MLRHFGLIMAVTAILCLLSGCVETKKLHCDECGRELTVAESSHMEEEWIVHCPECYDKLFSDHPILGNE